MDIVISQNESKPLTSPIKAQWLSERDGKLWKYAAGEVPGAYVAEADETLEQAATLSAEIAMLAKSNTFRVAVPDGMKATGHPRFVRLHLYNAGNTAAPAMAPIVDLATGLAFDPFFTGPSNRGAILNEIFG